MAILVPGWSRAGFWLNLSKDFGGFILFSKPVGPSHIMDRKKDYDQNVSVEPIFFFDIVNTPITSHVSKMLDIVGICVNNFIFSLNSILFS